MAILGTENKRYSNLVKYELEPALAYCREAVVVNDAAADFIVGTVLGKVTATGKYKVSVEDAVDGSEVPAAVVLEDKSVPATTDTTVLVIARGPAIIGKVAFLAGLDASFDDDTKKNFAIASIEALGIKVQNQV